MTDTSQSSASGKSQSTCSHFLRLPAELRLKIYRYVHINSRTIGDCRRRRYTLYAQLFPSWDQFTMDWNGIDSPHCYKRYADPRTVEIRPKINYGSSTCSLSAQLLSTCRVIYEEASHVLYGENTFGLHIFSRLNQHEAIETHAHFFEGLRLQDLDPPWPAKAKFPRGREVRSPGDERFAYQFPVKKMRKLSIVIDVAGFNGTPSPWETLYNLCSHLHRIEISDLNLDVRSRFPLTRFCILDPFLILRNIARVTFHHECTQCSSNKDCCTYRGNCTDEGPCTSKDCCGTDEGRCLPLEELSSEYKERLEQTMKDSTPLTADAMETYQ